jgi:hypothetical protein
VYGQSSTIDELVPNERLATSHEGKGAEFNLEGRAGERASRIVQSGFGPSELESLERGWGAYVETLRHYLSLHADEPAESTYSYAAGALTVEQARGGRYPRELREARKSSTSRPRSLGARVPGSVTASSAPRSRAATGTCSCGCSWSRTGRAASGSPT